MNKMVNGVLVAMTDAEIAEANANKPTEAEVLNEQWRYAVSYTHLTLPTIKRV